MAKKVSIINLKSRVGKSTLTANLAWYFAAVRPKPVKVLVVDLDPQFNASQYLLGLNEYEKILTQGKLTTWNILEQNTSTLTAKTGIPDPHQLIHNVVTFVNDTRIDLILSRLELAFSQRNPSHKERHLCNILAELENEYDLILIDCASTESVLTKAAYLASDYLLVPVKLEYLCTIGLPPLIDSMNDFKNDYNDHDLNLAGLVFNSTSYAFPEAIYSKAVVRQIADQNRWYVFNAEVPYSRVLATNAQEGRAIIPTPYDSTTQKEQFMKFTNEFAARIGL